MTPARCALPAPPVRPAASTNRLPRGRRRGSSRPARQLAERRGSPTNRPSGRSPEQGRSGASQARFGTANTPAPLPSSGPSDPADLTSPGGPGLAARQRPGQLAVRVAATPRLWTDPPPRRRRSGGPSRHDRSSRGFGCRALRRQAIRVRPRRRDRARGSARDAPSTESLRAPLLDRPEATARRPRPARSAARRQRRRARTGWTLDRPAPPLRSP